MDSKVSIEMDTQTAEDFKLFCQYKQEILAEHQNWKELRAFCKQIGYGSFNLSIENGSPKKVTNPLQTLVLGIHLQKKD